MKRVINRKTHREKVRERERDWGQLSIDLSEPQSGELIKNTKEDS